MVILVISAHLCLLPSLGLWKLSQIYSIQRGGVDPILGHHKRGKLSHIILHTAGWSEGTWEFNRCRNIDAFFFPDLKLAICERFGFHNFQGSLWNPQFRINFLTNKKSCILSCIVDLSFLVSSSQIWLEMSCVSHLVTVANLSHLWGISHYYVH